MNTLPVSWACDCRRINRLVSVKGIGRLHENFSDHWLAVRFRRFVFFLSLALKVIPLNAAYAIWSGLGMVATTVISVLIWKEKINGASVAGILLILAGVVILNLFGPGHGESGQSGAAAVERAESN